MISLLMFLGILTTVPLSDAQRYMSDGSSCQTGWFGGNCDMPICNPACQGDKVCLSPNNCGCLKTGSGGNTSCPYTQCSLGERLDCYPGTCDDTGLSCRCPTQYGFTGKNCLNITTTPQIKTCTVEVHDSSTQKTLLQNVNCAASGYNNSVYWINSASIGDIRATWDAWYDNGPALPGNLPVTYINPAPITIGLTKASVVITLLQTGQSYSANCDGTRERIDPPTGVTCDITKDWQTIGFPLLQHNQTFRVTVSAQLGGQKRVNLDGAPPQQFIGFPITRSAAFRIDLRPPVHCLTNNATSDCPYFAIYLDQDIRTNPKIEPRFYNWSDDGSGISNFNVKIFTMSNINGQLVNSGGPNYEQDVDPIQNDCLLILNTESGVYSVELTVFDLAGNYARARKLFIYNKDSNMRVDPGNPVYLKEANPSTNYTWLTSFENPKDGSNIPLTVTWKNHFISAAQFSGEWGLAATSWPPSYGIDDKYGTRYGRRSIESIQALPNGIASYAVAYVLDPSGGGKGLSPPSWVILSATNISYQLPISQSLSDGNTIVVWLQATDAAFGTITEKLVIGVDRTVPEVKQESFQLKTGQYKTNTTLMINVADRESGIANITYRIFTSGLALPLAVAQPKTRAQPPNRAKRDNTLITPCNANDSTCYCIPQGLCFDYIQTIDVNNCDIDPQYFRVQYTVENLADARSIEQTIDLGVVSTNDIPCRITITATPEIRMCMVEVHDYSTQETLLQNVNCATSGYNNSVFWINSASIGDIRANWDAWYDNGPALPGNPTVTDTNPTPVTIGVTKASVVITLIETEQNYSANCDGAIERIDPPTAIACDINTNWQIIGFPTPQHNQNFRVTVSAQLGGQKQVTAATPPQQFIGFPITRSAAFRFDFIPPVHCLTFNVASDCPYSAIYLDQDIRTNPKIEPRFYNWTDDGSGIDRFNVKIFKMSNINGWLQNSGDPLSEQNVDPIQNDCSFILNTESGVYSIELTVYDLAGNTARARKLFIYNKDSNMRVDPVFPVYLKEANPLTNYTWLTNFENPRDGANIPLTVTWGNHFISTAQFSGDWGLAAKPWLSSDGIDDKYGTRYGRRSIEAIDALPNGIASYAVAYVLDPSGGGRGMSPPSWVILSAPNIRYQLPINQSLSDGNTIVVWVQATDAAFGTITEKLVIGVDRTVPEVKQQSFQLKTGQYKTNTTLMINVADQQSGIANISYRIFASGLSLPLTVAQPKTRAQPASRAKRDNTLVTPCYANDTTCYCIPQGPCFDYIQTIDIDNCEIDRYAGQYFRVQYTVLSLAGGSSIEQTFDLGFLSANEIPCRPPIVLSPGAIAGIFFGVLFGIILLIVLIIVLVLLCRIYYYKKPVPRRIDNIRQTIRNRNAKSYEDENPAYETGGAFTGMVNKLSVKFKRASTNKGKDVDDDDYIYTGSEAVRNNSTHIQRKNLQMDETISTEGRFAVIKKAFLQDGNERKVVAVKALRSGFFAADVRLMEEKIQFLSGVPRHANLVNFLGASEEENNGGPIMILEHCSMSLKDWLKSNRKVTSEVLESMLTFTLNIARGVEHLHANDIIHRRLAVRNVLLTQQFGGWVAKLIGFGPNREDSDDKAKKVAVPVKWLSPETLSTINDIDPTYNQKTDAWSFGITIWEIYSLGETPYPHKNSNEAKRLIIKGLKPTKPDECPPELFESAIQPCWETSPGNRPTMTKVCSAIEAFRSGSGAGGEGYYATDDDDNYRSEAYGGSRGGGAGGGELYDDGR